MIDQFLNNNLNNSQKRTFINAFLAVIILLAVFLGVKALGALKEFSYIGRGVYPANVISVNGTGEVMAVPDTGSFSFSIIEVGKTVKEGQDKATKKVNAILDALKALGILEKDIKTTGYNSYPKYDYTQPVCIQSYPSYCPPSKQVLTGYEVSQTVTVKVRKTNDAGTVLTKVGELGATNISGLEFVIDDMDKVKVEARDKAITDAKEQAKILSKSLGIKLKRVVSFYENGVEPPIYYGGAIEVKAMSSDVALPPVPQTPVGENKIVSNVTITYEVE